MTPANNSFLQARLHVRCLPRSAVGALQKLEPLDGTLSLITIPLDDDLRSICSDILQMNLNVQEWSQRESCDMFQAGSFCGGFDADESAFCFSWHQDDGSEVWFQFCLEDAASVVAGGQVQFHGCLAS